MKKNLVAFAVAAAVLVPGMALAADSSNADTGPVLYGYGQITASQQFGTNSPEGLVFGAHRVRLGVKGEAVPGVSYNFQYKWDGAYLNSGGLQALSGLGYHGVAGATGVQKVWINFGFVPAFQVKVGKFRVPIGMERVQFSGDNLWFIQRSMNQSLGGDYGAGAEFHSPNVMNTGLYYNLAIMDNHSLNGNNAFYAPGGGVASPLGSPTAAQADVGGVLTNGSGNYLFAGMVGYKLNPLLNVELSGGRIAANHNINPILYAKSVDSWNVGARGGLMGLHYMAEYSHVTSYQGIEGLGAQDWYVAVAANLHQMTLTPDWLDLEPAFRFERFSWTGNNALANLGSGLNNYTIGLNYYVNPNNPHAAEVQLNYIVPSGAGNFRKAYANRDFGAVPANAYIYNTLALQFQAGF